MKHAFASAPLLVYPNYEKPFYIACDASNVGVGGVLYQPDKGTDAITASNIVAICSKKLNNSQQRYSVYKKELYGVVYSLRKFHSYIWGRTDNVLYTDHKPLTYIYQSTNLCVALQQWLDIILDYRFVIRYREGKLNVLPDMLSRMYVAAYKGGPWGVGNNEYSTTNINIDIKQLVLDEESKERKHDSNLKGKEEIAQAYDINELDHEEEKEKSLSTEERIKLINHVHSLGHFGRQSIEDKLKSQGYKWKNMRREIQDELIKCDACIKYTVTAAGYHPASYISSKGPWLHIQIDTSVHLPTASNGDTVLLVVIDVFTGYIILRALKSNTGTLVATELWKIFALFGLPNIIQSDNGSEFVNNVIKELVKLINVQHRLITPYNPGVMGR